MTAYEKLQELQITLPVAQAAVAAFVPTVRTGNLLFVSGHIAKRDGKPWAGNWAFTSPPKKESWQLAVQRLICWQLFTMNSRIWKR